MPKTEKKQPVKKLQEAKTELLAWNTIHIFGYGESQIIGGTANGKVDNESLKAITPLIDHLASLQQKGTKISQDNISALNIFNGSFVDFLPKSEKNKSQRIAWSDIEAKYINKLAKEITDKMSEPEPRKRFINAINNTVKATDDKKPLPAINKSAIDKKISALRSKSK